MPIIYNNRCISINQQNDDDNVFFSIFVFNVLQLYAGEGMWCQHTYIHTYIEILKNNRENIENCLLLLLINKLIIIIIISNINYVVVACLTND